MWREIWDWGIYLRVGWVRLQYCLIENQLEIVEVRIYPKSFSRMNYRSSEELTTPSSGVYGIC